MTTKHILVTFGSKHGGTEGIAAEIAAVLRTEGHDVQLRRASEVTDVSGYDGVVIGGGLYMLRWTREARRFVHRHARALRERPVWMFSSGPLDASASEHVLPLTSSVTRLLMKIGARGHATFGGRLPADVRGFPAAQMARSHAGDWRDWQQIRTWAKHVATDFATAHVAPVPEPGPRGWLAALCLLVGAAAIVGGLGLVARPDGSALRLPLAILEPSPFHSFLIPGLVLLIVIGFGSLTAGVLVIRDTPRADAAALLAGMSLLVWITAQMTMLRTINGLQLGCLAAGIAIVMLALRRHDLTSPRVTTA